MNSEHRQTTEDRRDDVDRGYRPPTVTFLGSLAELTQQKEVGLADGSTFLGLDIGS